MAELAIASFKFGLDTRRSELTSQPGTLVQAENCHVNQGGQLEKRYGFFNTVGFTTNTFGLESTDAGLIVFASRKVSFATVSRSRQVLSGASIEIGVGHGIVIGDTISVSGLTNAVGGNYNVEQVTVTNVSATNVAYVNAGTVEGAVADTGGTVTLWAAVGIGIQRIQHPAVLDGATYDAQYHAMTKLKWSYVHLGKSFVDAEFADGRSFLYYNGVLIEHSRNGMALNGWTTTQTLVSSLADSAIAQINVIGWEGENFQRAGEVVPGDILIPNDFAWMGSPVSVTFTMDGSVTSALGELAGFDYNSSSAGTLTGTRKVDVVMVATNGVNDHLTITAPLVTDTSKTVILFSGYSNYTTDANFAAALVNQINIKTEYTGWSASAVGATLTIFTSLIIPIVGNVVVTVTGAAGTAGTYPIFTAGSYVKAFGDKGLLYFWGNWVVGDSWTMSVVSTAGSFTLGKGRISDSSFVNGFVFRDRAYLANSAKFSFSAISDVTSWEQQNTGAGFVSYASQYGQNDTVQAFAAYQGKLVVFGKQSTQIWQANADPANFALQQSLSNIGTKAPFSVGSLGELEVLFLADSGIRSLRTREMSLNAYVSDIGSYIDSLVLQDLAGLTDAQKIDCCGVVEPGANRYWLYVKRATGSSRIYVLNYFPTSKIIAWTTYKPTYWTGFVVTVTSGTAGNVVVNYGGSQTATVAWNTNANTTASDLTTLINAGTASHGFFAEVLANVVTVVPTTQATVRKPASNASTGDVVVSVANSYNTFIPQKFTVHNGQVFVRTIDNVYSFGGTDKATFDNSVVTVELPWLDDKQPFRNKTAQQINAALSGDWKLTASMDPRSALVEVKPNNASATGGETNDSTYGGGSYGFSQIGTHFKFIAQTPDTWGSAAVLSNLVMQYILGEEI